LLVEAGYDVHILEIGQATTEAVQVVKTGVLETGSGFLLGVGGGSKIDVAKLAACDLARPLHLVPTSAATTASPPARVIKGPRAASL